MEKSSSVKIIGLTRIQANTLALLAEEGKIADLINDKLETFISDTDEEKEEFQQIEDEIPSMNFDESEGDVDHEADFGG